MKYALFSVPVGTIYDLPQTIKEGEEGLVSTIGDEARSVPLVRIPFLRILPIHSHRKQIP